MGLKAGWLVLLSLPLLGQANQQPQQAPVFKSESALVLVDVVARDAEGRPSKIKAGDWHVFENGHERPIAAVDEHTGSAAAPTLQGHGWSNNRSGTHTAQRGLSIILVDSLNMKPADQSLARRYMLDALRQLPGGERFMVFLLAGDLKQISGTTDDLSLLENLLKKQPVMNSQLRESDPAISIGGGFKQPLNGDAGLGPGSEGFAEFERNVANNAGFYRAKITLQAMKQISEAISRQPGRKSLIWLTSSFAIDIAPSSATAPGGNPAPVPMPGPQRPVESNDTMKFAGIADFTRDVNRIAKELAAARVSVYPIVVNSLTSSNDAGDNTPLPLRAEHTDVLAANGTTERQASIDTARVTAEQTGGRATFNSNDITGAFTRAIYDGDNYYTVSFVPENKTLDGNLHPISIKAIPGIQLQYRRSYVARTLNSSDPRQTLRDALDLSLPMTWQIESAGRYLPNPPSTVELRVSTADLVMKQAADGKTSVSLLLGYVAAPKDGGKPEMSLSPVELTLSKEQRARAEKQGLVLSLRPQLPARDCLLRVGIIDLNSRKIGTLDVDTRSAPRDEAANVPKPLLLPNGRNPDPEDGILTDRVYRNIFFDFTLTFPRSSTMVREQVPIMPSGNHALLAVSFNRGTEDLGGVAIYAIAEAVAPSTDPSKAVEIELEEARKAGDTADRGFIVNSYWSCSNAIKVCTTTRFFKRAGYLLKMVTAATRDAALMGSDEHAQLRFAPGGEVNLTDGELYHGPTVPVRTVDLALTSKLPPVDPGELKDRVYSNSSLGFEYGVPAGWTVIDHNNGDKSFERLHVVDVGRPAERQHHFFQACSQPLLYLQHMEPEIDQTDYLSLFSIAPDCLDVPMPASWNDKEQVSSVAEFLSLFSVFGEDSAARRAEISGRKFLVLEGEISFPAAVSGMQERRHQTTFITVSGKRLLAWFLVSKKSSNVAFPAASLRFIASPTVSSNSPTP